MKHPRALVILAEGAEEMEATIVVDILRRAQVDVVLAGLDSADPIRCSRGVQIVPDVALANVTGSFDAIILPGGKGGADRLAASSQVGDLLRAQQLAGRTVAAICAAPIALVQHKLFAGCKMTCHPSVNDIVAKHAELSADIVVEDGLLITSQGPGTAFPFALALVSHLCGADVATRVRSPLQLPN